MTLCVFVGACRGTSLEPEPSPAEADSRHIHPQDPRPTDRMQQDVFVRPAPTPIPEAPDPNPTSACVDSGLEALTFDVAIEPATPDGAWIAHGTGLIKRVEPGEKGWTQTVDILMTTGEVVTLHTSLPDGRTVGLVELETINIYAGVIPGAWLSRYVALWGATHGELRHYQYEGTFANASSFDCDSGSPCPGVSQTSTFCTETVACGERAHTDSVVSAAITGPSSTLQPGKSVVADGLEYLLGEATVGLSKPCADERPTWVRAAILGSDL